MTLWLAYGILAAERLVSPAVAKCLRAAIWLVALWYNVHTFLRGENLFMTDNELLLALSNLFDKKLKPIENRLTNIELSLENDVRPRLQNIEKLQRLA